MNPKFKLAALIAGGYLFIGVFRIYGSAQLSHYFLGDDEPLVLSAKEILSRGISLFASAGILFGITLLFTRRLYQAIDNHTALFQKDPNPLAIFNLDTLHYVRANPAFLSVLGYTEKQVKFITIHDSENVAKAVQHLVLQNSTEFVSLGIWEVLLHDGTFAKMEGWISLTQWNNVQRGLVRMHDVTRQHDYEQQLRDLNNDLEKQVALRTRELAEMNHELQAYNEELHATNEAAIQANELIQQANSELSRVHSQLKIKSEQLIQQSKKKLNRILDTVRDVVWAGHISGNVMHIDFVNSAIDLMLGTPVEQLLKEGVPEDQLIYGGYLYN